MNLRHYNKAIQQKSNLWWRSLSMNDWRALEKKHNAIRFNDCAPLKSEIARMWELEMAEFAGATQ